LRYDWSNRAAFETIDTTRDFVLNHKNIQQFLRLNNFYATEGEIVAIIRRLDVDADQQIKYDEWCEAVRPSAPPLNSSSSGLGSSGRFEEEKRPSSPLRASAYGDSPSRQKTLHDSQLSSSQLSSSNRFASPSRLGSSSYGGDNKRQSPLKQDEEEELVRAFKEQIAQERELEDTKVRLAQQSDFNLADAFFNG